MGKAANNLKSRLKRNATGYIKCWYWVCFYKKKKYLIMKSNFESMCAFLSFIGDKHLAPYWCYQLEVINWYKCWPESPSFLISALECECAFLSEVGFSSMYISTYSTEINLSSSISEAAAQIKFGPSNKWPTLSLR